MLLDRTTIRLLLGGVLALAVGLAACTSPENEGGTPLPAALTEAPLYDEAIGPSDEQEELDEEDGTEP